MFVKKSGTPDQRARNSDVQSGDVQQMSDVADADSESIKELAEEGNGFEAAAVDGVENAKDPDVSEVTTLEDRVTRNRNREVRHGLHLIKD
jgi:hypothetical protein